MFFFIYLLKNILLTFCFSNWHTMRFYANQQDHIFIFYQRRQWLIISFAILKMVPQQFLGIGDIMLVNLNSVFAKALITKNWQYSNSVVFLDTTISSSSPTNQKLYSQMQTSSASQAKYWISYQQSQHIKSLFPFPYTKKTLYYIPYV